MNEPTPSDDNKQPRSGKVKSRKYRELWRRPGYLVRRLHQIHVGLFAEECGGEDITPVQFGMLSVLQGGEGLDKLTLSTSVGVDRTSGADVIRRLERRGLLVRTRSEKDRRAKLIRIRLARRSFSDRVRTSRPRR